MADLLTTGRAPVPENAAEARAALCRAWADLQSVSDWLRAASWPEHERASPHLSEAFRMLILIDRIAARLDGE